MAPDRTPSSSGLTPETVDALRSTLRHALSQGRYGADLGDVLIRAAAEARAASVPPEQLLITLKGIWHSLPEVTAAASPDHATPLLQELISRCIEQYYAR
jgi:hypothetical protein